MASGAQSKTKEAKPKIHDGMAEAPEGWKTVKEWAKWFKDELAEYETDESVIEEAGIRAALKPSKTSKGKVVDPAIRRGGDNPEAVRLADRSVVISPDAKRIGYWKDKLEDIKSRTPKKVNQAAVELEALKKEYEALKAENAGLAEELEALKLEMAELRAENRLLKEGWVKKED